MKVADIPVRPSPDPAGIAPQSTPIRFGWNPRLALIVAAVVTALLGIQTLLVAVGSGDVIPLPVRVLVAVAGAVVIPGIPIVVMLRIPGRALAASLAVSVSMAATLLSAHFAMVLAWWHPVLVQMLIVLGSLALCAGAAGTLPRECAFPARATQRLTVMTRERAGSLTALAVSVALFVAAARTLDYRAAGHFGIITEVGPFYIVGLALVCSTIAVALTRTRVDHVVMAVASLVLVTYTTMLVPAATGQTSVPTAFVHRGFIATLAESGVLPDAVDARFSWAAFFSAGAQMLVASGLPDAGVFLAGASLVFGGLLLFPLYAIAIVVTGRARSAWLAVVLYQLFNWYQQDYFAPQAVALILYATVIATLLWQLRRAPLPATAPGLWGFVRTAPRRTPGLVPGFGTARTTALGAVLLLLIGANTVTHQITPILTIIALACFAIVGATRYRTLWLAAGLIFAAWFSYGATDFWMGHLKFLIAEIGQVGNAVERGVGNRLSGDPTYQSMQYLRIAASAGFALVAFAGWLLSRRRRPWPAAGLVAGAPFSLVALQSYGGEMIIRCFVLASPMLAPFAAIAVVKTVAFARRLLTSPPRVPAGSTSRRPAVIAGALALIVVSLVLTTNRGLNTSFEMSTTEMVEVTDRLIAEVPPDSKIMPFSHAPHAVGPRRILDPEGPILLFVDSYSCIDDLARCALARGPEYMLVTRQGTGMMRLQYGLSEEYIDSQIARIRNSGFYVSIFDHDGTIVLRRTDAPDLDLGVS
ncbi:hypothetical protein SAMN02745947_02122 [Rhodococcus rhodochrous J3]|uniref:Serine/threonine protein kinase n=1 Tax=Rhodococcus rhodochrous J3 TaxID=903528 RepID=A0ABY1M9P2_RHORH|nr:hypothetical protein [Rhodococcus rhodochrous]TWH52949.1 hypothetical protein L612_000200002660 [Rhodococcus rhodochrous J38]SMG31963.1 hypothetical protein SAMN02745947_02122 [Rhodococcus rhodochrous J3]